MKPKILEIEGLNSFEGKQVLDFSKISGGVFGIFGKTGSGKSTILDAITLALYGEVGRSKQNSDFINTKTKKTNVSFEFEIYSSGKNRTYVVKRKFVIRKNGLVDSDAGFYEKTSDGELKMLAEGSSKVTNKVFMCVGLGVDEFVKCIALPQGEFAAFLKARPSERTEIMSNIFDLKKYGEKLVNSVKRRLVNFDKNVTALSAGSELVSYATDEALFASKQKLENVESEHAEATGQLANKTEELKNLENLAEKHKKLNEIEEKLQIFEKDLPEIEKLKGEVQKNLNASEVKSDYEKLKQAIVDERELSEKIALLNEGKLKAQTELDLATRDYDDFNETFSSRLIDLNSKLAKLNELDSLAEELKNYSNEKEKIEQKIDEKRKELTLAQDNFNYILSNLQKIDDEIEKIETFISTNKPDVDLSYALEQTKDIESELILIEEVYKNVERLIDQTNDDLASVQSEYDSAIVEEKKFQAKRDQIQKSIEVAFEDADGSNIKKLRNCDNQIASMKAAEASVKSLSDAILVIMEDTDKRLVKIAELDEKMDVVQAKLTDAERMIAAKQVDIETGRSSREKLIGGNFISLISSNLTVGDFCPVCNGRVMQRNYGEKIDLSSVEGEIEKQRVELKNIRRERDKIFAELVSLKAEYEFEKKEIEVNRREVKRLESEKTKFYQKFVDINDSSSENFKKLQELLSKTAGSLEDLLELQSELRIAEQRVVIQKVQAGTKVTIYKNYLESLIDILYDLQKKKAEREFAIYNISEEYKNLKEYKKQIAEGKNIELLIDSKKEEKYKLRDEQNRLNGEKSNAQQEIAKLSAEIDVLEEKLSNAIKQKNILSAKIVTSGVPDGVSVETEKSETEKAIAKLKYDYDDKKLKVEIAKENLNRTEKEYDVKSLVIVSRRSEISELRTKIDRIREDSGFASNDELESYFVDPSVLKNKQIKISDFESGYKLLTMQKQEIGDDGVIAPDGELESLRKEIETLEAKVKLLTKELGKVGSEYERVKTDNKKYSEINEKLRKERHLYEVAKELQQVLKGKALAEYVAEEYLVSITKSANHKLALLLDGKYTLKFENKEFVVDDNLNDGITRSTSTLSGGETFLVSLALALSISESISLLSARSMDFFFLDEGFGTLDAELCDTVAQALYKLESQNLSIGLITHVTELEERIKNRVYVEKGINGSKIEVAHSL